VANHCDKSIRHVISPFLRLLESCGVSIDDPCEELGQFGVHQPEHDEADKAENEHADSAYHDSLAELHLGRLSSHSDDTGPRPLSKAANPSLKLVLADLHLLLKRAIAGIVVGHV